MFQGNLYNLLNFHSARGTIVCQVTSRRQYSSDLPKGGLEVPCVLMFNTKQAAEKEKAKRLIEGSLSSGITIVHTILDSTALSPKSPLGEEMSNTGEVPSSIAISSETSTSSDPGNLDMHIVVTDGNNTVDGDEDDDDCKPSAKRPRLGELEIESIVMGVELSDIHINIRSSESSQTAISRI